MKGKRTSDTRCCCELWTYSAPRPALSEPLPYAVAILLLMRLETDALRLAPFEEAAPAYRAILFAALALFFSAAVDAFVSFDLTLMRENMPHR